MWDGECEMWDVRCGIYSPCRLVSPLLVPLSPCPLVALSPCRPNLTLKTTYLQILPYNNEEQP